MNCKQCGVDLNEKPYRMVAHWHFCRPCFEALFNKGGKGGGATEEPEKKEGETTCVICEETVSHETACRVLGLLFCRLCYQGLVGRPALKARGHQGPEPLKGVPQVRVEVGKTLSCEACGRRIPALGRKEKDGRALCPECFYGDGDAG